MNCTNIMKRAFAGILVMSTALAAAAPISPEQALNRIQSSSLKKLPGNTDLKLCYTEQSEGVKSLYVFNSSKSGFVVTSADDRLPALLGYSYSGNFNYENASPELKWWLGQYAKEAKFYFENENDFAQSTSQSQRINGGVIPNLISTTWDQGSPYNNDCPADSRGRCVTGCVATAMAQVVNYYKYPVNGTGSYSYNWNGTILGFDYSSANFDWSNMLDNYTGHETPEQQAAVAKLMYACGVAVNMEYSSNESGASDIYVASSLRKYFNYDNGVRFLKRDFFTNQEWEELIYNELIESRPVVYGGQAPDGGHEFVCDGYDGQGYFHINWGWSGHGNGYFLLSALDPGLQGIGGFSGGYNSEQTAIVGIQPPSGNSFTWYPIYAMPGISAEKYPNRNDAVNITFPNGGIYNFSPDPASVEFLVKAVSDSGDEYLSNTGVTADFPGAQGLQYSGFTGIAAYLPSGLPTGNYKTYPVFRTPEGTIQEVLMPVSGNRYFNLGVDAYGNVSITNGEPEVRAIVHVDEIYPLSNVVQNTPANFKLTITNEGDIEYGDRIIIRFYPSGSDQVLDQAYIGMTIPAGTTYSYTIPLTLNYPEGEYDIRCFDVIDEPISEVFSFSIGTPAIAAEGITLSQTEASMVEGDRISLTATVSPDTTTDKTVTWSSSDEAVASVADGLVTAIAPGNAVITARTSNGLEASCNISVYQKEPEIIFATSITLDKEYIDAEEGTSIQLKATVLPDDTSNKTVTWSSSNEKVATVDQDGLVTIVKSGSAVVTASTTDGSDLSAICIVTGLSGIDALIAKEGEADVYTVNGILLRKKADWKDVENLEKGIYILYIAGHTYKIQK